MVTAYTFGEELRSWEIVYIFLLVIRVISKWWLRKYAAFYFLLMYLSC